MNDAERKPYRENVAAIVVDARGMVLVGWKHEGWQLPQGGVSNHETFDEALVRELTEEIGTGKFHIDRKAGHVHCYDWPEDSANKRAARYRGQRQRYYLVVFDGVETDLNAAATGEFSKLAWQTPDEVLRHAWGVKRPGYEAAFRELGLV